MNIIDKLNVIISNYDQCKEISFEDKELVSIMSSFAIMHNSKTTNLISNPMKFLTDVKNLDIKSDAIINEKLQVFSKIQQRTKLSIKGKSPYGQQQR